MDSWNTLRSFSKLFIAISAVILVYVILALALIIGLCLSGGDSSGTFFDIIASVFSFINYLIIFYIGWRLFLYVLYKVVYVASSAITAGKKNTKNTGNYENNV